MCLPGSAHELRHSPADRFWISRAHGSRCERRADDGVFVQVQGLRQVLERRHVGAQEGDRRRLALPGLRQVTAICLPYPPSANRYLRHALRRTYRTAEANKYRKLAQTEAYAANGFLFACPVSVEVTLFPKTTKTGQASRTVLDLDNCMKVALDAVQGILYVNDKQIHRLQASYGLPVAGGGLEIVVEPLDKE